MGVEICCICLGPRWANLLGSGSGRVALPRSWNRAGGGFVPLSRCTQTQSVQLLHTIVAFAKFRLSYAIKSIHCAATSPPNTPSPASGTGTGSKKLGVGAQRYTIRE
jgi:hypothetical protein